MPCVAAALVSQRATALANKAPPRDPLPQAHSRHLLVLDVAA